VVIDIDCIGSCKSNYHAITTTMVPIFSIILLLRIDWKFLYDLV
jgi:hypothetical protein